MYFSALALLATPLFAQPEIPFDSVPDFFKYPPEMNLGEMGSVAVNSQGHIFMASRSNVTRPLYGAIATQILEFDKNGNLPERDWQGCASASRTAFASTGTTTYGWSTKAQT